MKRILLALLPFVALADTCHLEQVGGGDWRIVCEGSGLVYHYVDVTNDVYAIADCEQLKQSLLYTAYALSQDTAANMSDDLQSILSSADTIRQQYGLPSLADDIVGSVDDINEELILFHRKMTDTSFDGYGSLAKSINDINCGSCPTNGASGGVSGGACCDVDFTDIIDRLIVAEQQRAAISNQISHISHYLGVVTNQLAYNNFLLQHGFHDVTNLFYSSQNSDYFDDLWVYPYSGDWYSDYSYFPNTLSGFFTIADILESSMYNEVIGFSSINNFFHGVVDSSLRSITNNVDILRLELSDYSNEATNFFSFFRGEIGVQGVLEDWTNVEADGTYHDFLTNHYINVVRHGSLSGYSYEKTNWFARVETLLAALVFRDEGDTTGTNLVDGARYDTEKQKINDALQDSISYLGAPVGKLQNMTEPLLAQLSVFSDAFSNAILPSHITLFSIGEGAFRSSSTTPFEVTFMVDSEQQAYYQIIRSCTTLCWVFVSLLLIYWFLVWSINKIIVIVRFFWNVGEMFMSRNG